MEVFVKNPDITTHVGIRVTEATDLRYEADTVKQTVKDLHLVTEVTVSDDGIEAYYKTDIQLKPGDVLLFEEGGRGYIKPVERFVSPQEAIEDLTVIMDMG